MIVSSSFLCPVFSQESENVQNSVSFATGAVYNLPLPLSIRQFGESKLSLTAKYTTKPFTAPFYYQIRYSRLKQNKGFEIEFIHHKLYLETKHEDIQEFTVTNGFNLLFVNMVFKKDILPNTSFLWRFGGGPVITHPESKIRNKKFSEDGGLSWFDDDGYFVSGLAFQAACELDYMVMSHLSFFAETKLSAAFASVPVASGFADMYNIALHGLLGVKFNF